MSCDISRNNNESFCEIRNFVFRVCSIKVYPLKKKTNNSYTKHPFEFSVSVKLNHVLERPNFNNISTQRLRNLLQNKALYNGCSECLMMQNVGNIIVGRLGTAFRLQSNIVSL